MGRSLFNVVRLQAKYLDSFLQTLYQCINLFFYGIDVKAGTRGRGKAKAFHQRLRAVMSGANRDSHLLIENGGEIMRVNIAQCKGDYASAFVSIRSIYGQPCYG